MKTGKKKKKKKRPHQKAGFKVPGWGGNHNLPVNTLEMSSSLFPLKHKHFHIYSVWASQTPNNPTPVLLLNVMPMYKNRNKKTQFKK